MAPRQQPAFWRPLLLVWPSKSLSLEIGLASHMGGGRLSQSTLHHYIGEVQRKANNDDEQPDDQQELPRDGDDAPTT